MQCYVYKSLKKVDMYLYLTQQDDFSSIPEPLLKQLGELEFVLDFDLHPERKLGREDPQRVLDSLAEKGFHLQMPEPIESLLKRSRSERLNSYRNRY